MAFGLRYHNLAAFFFGDIGDITGVFCWETVDLPISPKVCYDNAASAVVSRLTGVSAELPASQKNYGKSQKKLNINLTKKGFPDDVPQHSSHET